MAQPVQPVAAPAAFKMIEIGDVDVGQINKILPPATVVNQPKPPPPVLINAPVVTKPPTTVINDIIRGTNGKARIIVNPVKK
jgi:hypothetical protein